MPANHPADAITIENLLEIFFSKFRASSNSFFFFFEGDRNGRDEEFYLYYSS